MYEKDLSYKTQTASGESKPTPEEVALKGNLKNLVSFWPYIKKHPFQLGVLIVAILIASSSMLVFGRALEVLIDTSIRSSDFPLLKKGLLILFVLVACLAISSYLRLKSITFLGETAIAEIKQDIFKRLLYQPYIFFEKHKLGDLLSRLNGDALLMQMLISNSIPIACRNSLMMIGGIGLLFITNFYLALYVFVLAPLIALFVSILGKNVKKRAKNTQKELGNLSILTEESLTAIREIQAFSQETQKITLYESLSQRVVGAALSHMSSRSKLVISVMILVFTFLAFLLWTGGKGVIEGVISPGEMASFVFYAFLLATSVNALSEIIADIQRGAGAAERLKDLLSLPEAPTSKPLHPCPAFEKTITLESLSFSYPSRPDCPILENFSLTVRKGAFTAIVGPSGAGKTTLFHLLLKFYTPSSGAIKVDETPYADLTNEQIRSYYGYIPQDPHIFSGTLKMNVLFGKPTATDQEVEEVLAKCQLLDFVKNLPQGVETPVGEKGIRLSGGQKQRIAIARALIKTPRILLLDEPTSALDAKTEELIQSMLEELRSKNTTVLIISHRLSTIKKADQIYVLDQGKCVQQGTHSSLIKESGLYADLAQIQFD